MTNTQHTPGPWVNGGPQCATIATKAEGGNLGERVAIVFDDEISLGDAKANARLIAAAPELLAALQAMLGAAHESPVMCEDNAATIAQARAIVSKARGE